MISAAGFTEGEEDKGSGELLVMLLAVTAGALVGAAEEAGCTEDDEEEDDDDEEADDRILIAVALLVEDGTFSCGVSFVGCECVFGSTAEEVIF